mmetsp:Transcript_117677/g.327670  ORF Transcript_117677/g.327670 Transcript_117677/m.327670 type:complete len:185 (+) Transcript_117677:95-649(+)
MELWAGLLLATLMYRFGSDEVRRRKEKASCCGGIGAKRDNQQSSGLQRRSRGADHAKQQNQQSPHSQRRSQGGSSPVTSPATGSKQTPAAEGRWADPASREQRFQAAAQRVEVAVRQCKPGYPTQDQLLAFYGLYKQATVGDISGERPWATQFKARAKYDSWASNKGLNKEEAMDQYIRATEGL